MGEHLPDAPGIARFRAYKPGTESPAGCIHAKDTTLDNEMIQHPHGANDGYAVIRLLIPASSRFIGDHPTAWRCFISRRGIGPFAHIGGRNHDSAVIDNPGMMDWRNGEFVVRLLETMTSPSNVGPLKDDLSLASALWGRRVVKDAFKLVRGVRSGFPATMAEIICPRGIHDGCVECINAAINQATRAGVAVVNSFQVADSWAAGHSIDLISMETARPFVWLTFDTFSLKGELRESHRIQPVMPWAMVHGRPESSSNEAPPEAIAKVEATLRAISNDFLFARFIELVVDSQTAIYVHGRYEQGLMAAAQACEYLLDTLLLFLLWWEGLRPADAASEFRAAENMILTRVKNCYPSRLGPKWDMESSALATWRDCVLDIRNRVVHGGNRVTLDEASAALEAAKGLYAYCAEVAAEPQTVTTYGPLVALLVGDDALPEGFSGMREETFYSDHSMAKLRFRGWAAMFRNEMGLTPRPSNKRADVLLAQLANGGFEWWLHDKECHKVALANAKSIDQNMRREMEERARNDTEQGIRRRFISYSIDPPPSLASDARWQSAVTSGPGLPIECPWS